MAPVAERVILQQFAKVPEPGRVKTRMLVQLSAEDACALHEELVRWTCETLHESALGTVELWVAGDAGHPLLRDCASLGQLTLRRQSGADLGERMRLALNDGLARADRVLLVGSDCPALTGSYLQKALAALDDADLVLGPALDGGYVLIGARKPVDAVFVDVGWGSSRVLTETRERARAAAITVTELQPLRDIDRPEDLPHWQALRQRGRVRR
ncbi:TIGR04282 family arsenosugar biosynthesis glycosyltransferase [Haliea sp. E1-2-M8]|uniref:TIGR04282 family arsenosugar biosynthesis glycosyltransferase n=1 Tax=Haliea sp. E1-2-M8 TaxID=3064706 RepID=UPI0027249F53|nr:TIGR04282 family arsenosugar biosynthesis glycosyltransferase [Haliea sp. E1-2-M8]MDO8862831.1 TIGR04282 family arsenosugar biosynthesis glycosyltransferase [Haliea sp. E1-2-M8]